MSRFLLMVVPGVAASAVAVFVLYAVHVSRTAEPVERLSDLTPQGDGLSAEERRELTRQMLKDRRENPQEPAQVRPTPGLRPATTGTADDSAGDAKTRPATAAPVGAPLPRPAVARTQPAPAAGPATTTVPATIAALAPPPAAAPGPVALGASGPGASGPAAPAAPPAAAATEPTTLPPVTVNTPPPAGQPEAPPPPRSIAGHVFSSFSFLAGTAANATGNTVNWVIDLPGRAISAGGRLLGGGDSASSNPPPAPPAPAQPPAKRNYL